MVWSYSETTLPYVDLTWLLLSIPYQGSQLGEITGDLTAALFCIELLSVYRFPTAVQQRRPLDTQLNEVKPSLVRDNLRNRSPSRRVWKMWGGILFASLLGGLAVVGQTVEQKFFFYWPTETTQCQVRHFGTYVWKDMLMIDH